MQREVNGVDVYLFSVAYVSGFIARHVLCAVGCDDCMMCLTSPVMSTNAFIYFLEYKDDEQALSYPILRCNFPVFLLNHNVQSECEAV